nr:class II lanthipeptide, LchA2/BrtA2 family [Bacillus subtilis]
MSNREKAELYRNASKRTELGFVNPVGEVSEDELRNLAGATDVTPHTTPSSLPCGVFVTANFLSFYQMYIKSLILPMISMGRIGRELNPSSYITLRQITKNKERLVMFMRNQPFLYLL